MFIEYHNNTITNAYEIKEIDQSGEYFDTLLTIEELLSGNYIIYRRQIILNDQLIEIEKNNYISFNKNTRDDFLKKSDFTQLSDSPLSLEKKEEWKVYRQALRDLDYKTDPMNVVWPVLP